MSSNDDSPASKMHQSDSATASPSAASSSSAKGSNAAASNRKKSLLMSRKNSIVTAFPTENQQLSSPTRRRSTCMEGASKKVVHLRKLVGDASDDGSNLRQLQEKATKSKAYGEVATTSDEKKKRHWGCLICLNRHNPIKEKKCITCKQLRQNERYGLRDINTNSLYLCRADTGAILTNLHLHCIASNIASDVGKKFKVLMPLINNHLKDCVSSAFETFCTNRKDLAEGKDDNWKHSDFLTSSYYEDLKSKSQSSPLKIISSNDGNAGLTDTWATRSPDKTLFEQVMYNAKRMAYDSNIGRYVDLSLASPEHHKDMTYKSLMAQASCELSKQVVEVMKRRDDGNSLLYTFAPSKDELKQKCGLCEYSFPLSQLMSQVTFKAIANWRAKTDAPIDSKDIRLKYSKIHDATPICLFCTQFFDKHFSEAIDSVSVHESVGFDRKDSICKQMNFTNKAYKRIISQVFERGNANADRPLSRMKQSMAIEQLKFRNEASNPALRFQYNPKAVSTHCIDQSKTGKYLRTKYTDLGTVITEQRKTLKEEQNYKLRMSSLSKSISQQAMEKRDSSNISTAPIITSNNNSSGSALQKKRVTVSASNASNANYKVPRGKYSRSFNNNQSLSSIDSKSSRKPIPRGMQKGTSTVKKKKKKIVIKKTAASSATAADDGLAVSRVVDLPIISKKPLDRKPLILIVPTKAKGFKRYNRLELPVKKPVAIDTSVGADGVDDVKEVEEYIGDLSLEDYLEKKVPIDAPIFQEKMDEDGLGYCEEDDTFEEYDETADYAHDYINDFNELDGYSSIDSYDWVTADVIPSQHVISNFFSPSSSNNSRRGSASNFKSMELLSRGSSRSGSTPARKSRQSIEGGSRNKMKKM